MAHDSSRAFYFKRKGISFDYITTITTKKYGKVDVCGRYNCIFCNWEIAMFTQEYNNECVKIFVYYSVNTPTDTTMRKYAYKYMREFLTEIENS
jgi:hypothetical protein